MPVLRAGLQASTLALTTHVGALMYDCTAVPHLARDSHASHVPGTPNCDHIRQPEGTESEKASHHGSTREEVWIVDRM